jgi:hypothetical protein
MQVSGNWLSVEAKKRQRLDRYAQGSDDDDDDDSDMDETNMRNTVIPTPDDVSSVSDTVVVADTTLQDAEIEVLRSIDRVNAEIVSTQKNLAEKIHYERALRAFKEKISQIAARDELVLTVQDSRLIPGDNPMDSSAVNPYGEIGAQLIIDSISAYVSASDEPIVRFSVRVTNTRYESLQWTWVRQEDEIKRKNRLELPKQSQPPQVGDIIQLYSIYTNTEFVTLRRPDFDDPDFVNDAFVFLASSRISSRTTIYLN